MNTSKSAEGQWVDERQRALFKTVTDLDGRGIGASLPKPLRPGYVALLKRFNRLRRRIEDRRVATYAFYAGIDHFHSERTAYEPSDWSFLRRGLRGLSIGRSDVFVDFGSGKGRVLYQAARYPFGRIVGIEISEELNNVARENLERNRHRFACQNFELVTADAATAEVPDDMTVGYFYHPFAGETFARVLANIVASLDRKPRRVVLVYACPAMEQDVLATGRFRLDRRYRGRVLKDPLAKRVSVFVAE